MWNKKFKLTEEVQDEIFFSAFHRTTARFFVLYKGIYRGNDTAEQACLLCASENY